MTPRQHELREFSDAISWLAPDEARNSYADAIRFSSTSAYGLEPLRVARVEQHKVVDSPFTRAWLAERMRPESTKIRIVYGERDVFRTSIAFFLDNWANLFVPSRDDVLVLADQASWVLFYCHEDEFEFGWRIPEIN